MTKQQVIPGTMDPKNEKVHQAALAYVEARDSRMAMTETEVDLRETLLQAMKDAKRETYRHGTILVVIDHKEKPKVTVKDEEEQ